MTGCRKTHLAAAVSFAAALAAAGCSEDAGGTPGSQQGGGTPGGEAGGAMAMTPAPMMPGMAAMPSTGTDSGEPVPAGTAAPAPGNQQPMAGTGSETPLDCTITPSLSMSPVISTVAIVELTTDLAQIDEAHIEFGLDESYGMTAPVDLAQPGYRTLLLGMKPAREYHYRVVAMAGGQVCTSQDHTLQTGPPPNQPRLLDIDITTPQPDKLGGGFTVTGIFPTGPAFIIDADGDYVWWYDSGDATRVRMSYDGKHMWIRNANVNGRRPLIMRVSMDGMQVEEFGLDSEFGDSHHDFTVLPDESLIFIAHDAGGCDKIMERSPAGEVHEIINSQQATGSDECHLNSVHYFAEDDSVTFSDRLAGAYVKVSRGGEVRWVLGGRNSTFSGEAAGWQGGQHGHHVLAPDRLVMFANGATGRSSLAYELTLDEQSGTATRLWTYDGDNQTPVLGDVQRLPNGNTLVVYTTRGTVHEIDENQDLVQSMVWNLGGAVTYVQRRASLYGPPPR